MSLERISCTEVGEKIMRSGRLLLFAQSLCCAKTFTLAFLRVSPSTVKGIFSFRFAPTVLQNDIRRTFIGSLRVNTGNLTVDKPPTRAVHLTQSSTPKRRTLCLVQSTTHSL